MRAAIPLNNTLASGVVTIPANYIEKKFHGIRLFYLEF
jgi:hypothetical protein